MRFRCYTMRKARDLVGKLQNNEQSYTSPAWFCLCAWWEKEHPDLGPFILLRIVSGGERQRVGHYGKFVPMADVARLESAEKFFDLRNSLAEIFRGNRCFGECDANDHCVCRSCFLLVLNRPDERTTTPHAPTQTPPAAHAHSTLRPIFD